MGFIPIIFFTLAFLFLWAIVNYNSLKKTDSEIRLQLSKAETIVNDRKEIARKVLADLPDRLASSDLSVCLIKIVDCPVPSRALLPQFFNTSAAKSSLMEEINVLQQAENEFITLDLIDALKAKNQDLQTLSTDLKENLRNFKMLTTKPPSKFIARLFNFS